MLYALYAIATLIYVNCVSTNRMSSNNTNRNGFLMYPQSCFWQNLFGFDVHDMLDPFTKFKPDSFPFGSNWYYFCALYFVTAIMLIVLSNIESETQRKHKRFIEPLAFGMCVATLGVLAKPMVVSYTKGKNIYYNIQDMSLIFIASFSMIKTTSFHLLVMQPNIQKTQLLRCKGLIDLMFRTLCTMLFTVLIGFSLLTNEFYVIVAVTWTLYFLITPDRTSTCELRFGEYSFRNCFTVRYVIFLIALLHVNAMLWIIIHKKYVPWPIEYCCQYQNFTLTCIIDWVLFLNHLQNTYINEKMLPDELATKRRIDKIAMCERYGLLTGRQTVSLLMTAILANLPILAFIFVFKNIDIYPRDFLCYNESFTNAFSFLLDLIDGKSWSLFNNSSVYDEMCTNMTGLSITKLN